jgi:hypothetical protein
MPAGSVVAVEGASGAGKTTVTEAIAELTGWTPLPEAYRRLSPAPRLDFSSPAELSALEERLLREDARRYSEARARARAGETVIADTGFLGPLTYTWALVALGLTATSTIPPLLELARAMGARGEWGLADAYVYLDTGFAVRGPRALADPVGHPPDLVSRHQDVGELELGFYRDRFAPLLGDQFVRVSGDGPGRAVARQVVKSVRERPTRTAPAPSVDAVLALFEGSSDGQTARRSPAR